nr:hypothetical protein [Tanacetum cinerariifolium]
EEHYCLITATWRARPIGMKGCATWDWGTGTRSSIPYIILSDLEVEDATLPAAPAPLSQDYVRASPDYTLNSYSDSEPFKEDPQEADLEEYSEEEPLKDDLSDEDPMKADGLFQDQVTPILLVLLD